MENTYKKKEDLQKKMKELRTTKEIIKKQENRNYIKNSEQYKKQSFVIIKL